MPTEFPFRHRLEVRFRDCDSMGHVNHAVYLTYLEQSRFAFWRQVIGAPPGQRAGIIIARAEIDYRAPAFAGDLLEVRLAVAAIGTSSFTLAYQIVNVVMDTLLAEARTVLVTYDYDANRAIPVPDDTRGVLERVRAGVIQ